MDPALRGSAARRGRRTSKIRLTTSQRRPRGCGKEGFAAVCAADGRVRSACSTPPSVPWSCTMDTSSAAWDTGAANSPWRASNLLQAILAAPVATCAAHLEDRA